MRPGPVPDVGAVVAIADEQHARGPALLRIEQAHVVLLRELRVERKPDGIPLAALGTGQAHAEIDALLAVAFDLELLLPLRGRECLIEQRFELSFAVGSARLDVAQHLLEIAYADGQIADMREKHRSNDAALVALKHLADSRPAAVQQRANRQWVNMGDLFLKLPHKDVEGMLRTDQATLGDDIKELAKLKAQCQAQLTGSGADFRPGI